MLKKETNKMEIYNIKDKIEYLPEIITLSHNQWSNKTLKNEELQQYIEDKTAKIKNMLNREDYCKLILVDNKELIGFISIFPTDEEERKDLTPWYSTMYVKEKYRGKGYSKILNNAILKEAKDRGFKRIYLKTDLEGYYEKFGANYIEKMKNGEKLYYINLY